jgi:hypothetical protein
VGGFIFTLKETEEHSYSLLKEIQMNDLSMTNILSLHQELMKATEMNELYCNQNDLRMSELWLEQMNLIVDEMKTLGDDK